MSIKNHLIKVFHFIAALQFFYALYYEVVHVLPEELKLRKYEFGGKLVYLTFINGIFHATYHAIALVNDFIGSNEVMPEKSPMIKKVKDYMFATFCFPLGMNVSVLFWSLYHIDRELVFPTIVDAIYPSWLNHILHTNPLLIISIEMCILYHHYPSRKAEVTGISVFIIMYIGWVHVIKLVAGAWVYPILNVLDMHHRIGFFFLSGSIPIAFYFVGEFLNKELWTKRRLSNAKEHHK